MKEFHIHVISVIIGTDAVLKAIQSHFMKEFHIHVIIVIVDQYISCDIILFTCVGFIQDAIIFNLFKNIYQHPPSLTVCLIKNLVIDFICLFVLVSSRMQ